VMGARRGGSGRCRTTGQCSPLAALGGGGSGDGRVTMTRAGGKMSFVGRALWAQMERFCIQKKAVEKGQGGGVLLSGRAG
jgi:hypothetical protein